VCVCVCVFVCGTVRTESLSTVKHTVHRARSGQGVGGGARGGRVPVITVYVSDVKVCVCRSFVCLGAR